MATRLWKVPWITWPGFQLGRVLQTNNGFYVLLLVLLSILIQISGTKAPPFSQFYFSTEPRNVIAVKGKPILLNCSVHHTRLKAEIEWRKNGKFIDFEVDSRRHKLENGSLYFTEIQHARGSDTDKGNYQCVATLDSLGSIVSRVANIDIAYMARNFDAEPTIFKPALYLGDTAVFPCKIQGIPKPKVAWFKDGKRLNPRSGVHIYPTGVLEISELRFEDFASYECEARNIGRVRKSRRIAVEQNSNVDVVYQSIPPTFVIKPNDTRAIRGNTIYLHCAANGRNRENEQPKIAWLRNAKTITLKNEPRYSIVGKGTLRIISVQESDNGAFTCRATNTEDSVDAVANLEVLISPQFLRRPKNVFAHLKGDAKFECEVAGHPKPKISWLKDGDFIESTDYLKITVGSLRILGMVSTDDGLYQCFAENEVGSAQVSAQLVIIKKDAPLSNGGIFTSRRLPGTGTVTYYNQDHLPSKARDLVAVIVSTRFVTLSWKPPQRTAGYEIEQYTITWKEKGSNRERTINTTTEEANIQHLKQNTEYEFLVTAYNEIGPSNNPAVLRLKTDPEVFVPSAVMNLNATPLSSTSIGVNWAMPENPNGEIIQYELIHYEVGETNEHSLMADETSHILNNLRPFTEYSFRILAHNQNGAGVSTEEIAERTYSDRPTDRPQNVTLEVSSTTSIIVRWEPPPKDARNGVITGYKIRHKKRGNRRGLTVTTDGNRRTFALTDLHRHAEYMVRLAALTVNGSGPVTEWFYAKTLQDDLDETRVPGQPTKLRVIPMSNSVIVSWAPPEDTGVMVRGYILGYGVGIPDVYEKQLDAKQLYYTIENLRAASEYIISIRAYNKLGRGRPIMETAFTTEEATPEPATPMIPPMGLKAIVLSAKTIILTWTDTSLGRSQRITDNRYYTVRYTSVPNKNSRYRVLNSTDLNAHIDDLKPNMQYDFSVKVIKGRRQSTWSLSVINTTFESAPGSVPGDLTPVPVEDDVTAVALHWQPPEKPNGQITGYLVFYTTDQSQLDTSWVVEGVLGDELSLKIKDLTPDTTYYFKVQARNSKGYGPMSPTVIYRTPKADGTGGGRIETSHDGNMIPNPRDRYGNADNSMEEREDEKEKEMPTSMLIIIIACVAGVALIVIIVVTVILCRRRADNNCRKHRQNSLQKSPVKAPPKEMKPPDLWLHDQMELKNIDKSQSSDVSVAGTHRHSQEIRSDTDMHSGSEMDRRGSSFGQSDSLYDPRSEERYVRPTPIRPKPMMIPVDSQYIREPIATVTAIPNGHILQAIDPVTGLPLMRPVYPRTQYNTQYTTPPRVHAGDVSQPSSIGYRDDEEGSLPDSILEETMPFIGKIGYGPHSPDIPPMSMLGHQYHSTPSDHHHHHPYNQQQMPLSPSSSSSGGGYYSEGYKSLPRRTPTHSLKGYLQTGGGGGGGAPPLSAPVTPIPKQIVKPQQTSSPYKKPNPPIGGKSAMKSRSPMPLINRAPPDVLKAAAAAKDESADPLQKSLSTEELTAEMENLEGLMKDLNAITQQEFEC